MALYEELRRVKSNVVISCLCPGPVETNFNNVAGGSFVIKGLKSEDVAKYAVDKMFKKNPRRGTCYEGRIRFSRLS